MGSEKVCRYIIGHSLCARASRAHTLALGYVGIRLKLCYDPWIPYPPIARNPESVEHPRWANPAARSPFGFRADAELPFRFRATSTFLLVERLALHGIGKGVGGSSLHLVQRGSPHPFPNPVQGLCSF